jgi:hypothetical protein
VRTVVHKFAGGTWPAGLDIDAEGDYIVTEHLVNVLSKITSSGIRTVIHTFDPGTLPVGVVARQLHGPVSDLTPRLDGPVLLCLALAICAVACSVVWVRRRRVVSGV